MGLQLSDRDVSIALFNLVGALAERLTGEVPEVRITDREGNSVWVRPAASEIRWGATPAGAGGRCAHQAPAHSTPSPPPRERYAS
jgi:hypothetical protein